MNFENCGRKAERQTYKCTVDINISVCVCVYIYVHIIYYIISIYVILYIHIVLFIDIQMIQNIVVFGHRRSQALVWRLRFARSGL